MQWKKYFFYMSRVLEISICGLCSMLYANGSSVTYCVALSNFCAQWVSEWVRGCSLIQLTSKLMEAWLQAQHHDRLAGSPETQVPGSRPTGPGQEVDRTPTIRPWWMGSGTPLVMCACVFVCGYVHKNGSPPQPPPPAPFWSVTEVTGRI